MADTKKVSFGKMYIADEREPGVGIRNSNMQQQLNIDLVDDDKLAGELGYRSLWLNPESDVSVVCHDTDALLSEIGCCHVPSELQARVAAIHAVDPTPLTLARYRVTRNKEIVRQLGLQTGKEAELAVAQGLVDVAKAEVADLETPCSSTPHKETRVNRIDVSLDGRISVRLRLCVCESGEIISPKKYHRVDLEPLGNSYMLDMLAMVGRALERGDTDGQGSYPSLILEGVERLERIASVEHTPEVIEITAEKRRVIDAATEERENKMRGGV